uniref:Villin like n=1 Tax=Amphiprion percula TaxID=161767 RepID=A0A3P8TK63_AMPPE
MSDDKPDAFRNVSRKPGLQIWTINNMQMAPVPAQGFGNFFEGDCYIVLYVSSGQSIDIHYWIGKTSSQDEQGSAAIYVTQLDEFLGGSPVQHREVQGCESPRFRSYFKNGLIYKKGGVASGFHHVDTNVYNVLRLLHVKGRKHVTATEVEVSWNSFNNGDIFLLDVGKAIVQWNGPQSNRREKLKVTDWLHRAAIQERGGRAQIGVVEGGDERDSPELNERHDDCSRPRSLGNLVVQEVATQPLTQDLLRSGDCYIWTRKVPSVMVWKGKHASQEDQKLPTSTSVEVMSEGGESAMFKHLFNPGEKKDKLRVWAFIARPDLAAQQRMVDDVWRIENLELAEVDPSTYGQFYGGDCYLVLYSYQRSHQLQHILYMWQGRHATTDEITACAYQAVNIDNKYNGAPVQVRVVMGKEPRHFLAIFKGKLLIFEGGTGRPGVVNPNPAARLFQVRGTSEMNTKATEVPSRASSLNTNDVFLLKTDHKCYLWYGKGCNGDERVMGRAISDVLSRQDKQVVMEGQEPAEFWVALGGKAPYASDKRLQREEPRHSPRLFECSNQTGQFRMTEDVMLLDTWRRFSCGVGKLANQAETKEAWNSAQEYLRFHPAGRDPDTPIIFIKQGYEPLTFTGWGPWDWSVPQTLYSLQPVHPRTPTSPRTPSSVSVAWSSQSSGSGTYVNPKLLINQDPSDLPDGVDPTQKEDYLSDVDFENLLGTTRLDFHRLPKWRQNDLKKKAGLF